MIYSQLSLQLMGAMIAVIIGLPCFAQVPDNPEVLEYVSEGKRRSFTTENNQVAAQEKIPEANNQNHVRKQTAKPPIPKFPRLEGNLPYYALRDAPPTHYQSGIVMPQTKSLGERLEGLNVGDLLKCRISQSFKAYDKSQIPIRAVVTDGRFKGGVLIGEASMDQKAKVVKITFTELRTQNDQLYSFSGGVFAKTSEELTGEYETHYWQYFWSEALLAATSGYAQSTVERSKNALGQYETENNPDNAAKLGVAAGLSTTVRELSERGRSAPEFIRIEGPIFIEVMVLKEATKKI